MTSEPPPANSGIPRGALLVVAVGLLACLAAAALATDKTGGDAAYLEWVQRGPIADSKPVAVPGGKGEMQLIDGRIDASGVNVAGYSLYRVFTRLRIDAGSPVGDGRVFCETKGGPRSEIARSSGNLRALYPRSADNGIYTQAVPEELLLDFSARGNELSIVEAEDLGIEGFTTEKGIKLEWPEYTIGRERLKYFIAGGKPVKDLELPFYTVWKTQGIPSTEIACTLTTSAGEVTAKTAGALKKSSPPIDEEAEELAEEERVETDEEAEDEGEEDSTEG